MRRTEAADAADRRWMREALALAARGRGRTAPNPMVGAVVVRGGRVVGAGHHARAGAPHAEALALRRAGRRARGATLYVTLEPCAHWGRTPPCVEAVLASGLRRVVVAELDRDPRTGGRSLRRLRSAGLEVRLGVERAAAHVLNRGYHSRLERRRPWTMLKLATSLDGRIATRAGESRWITGPRARAFVHALRAGVDAIAVGSGTVLADDPELSARRGARTLHRPLRIVVDSAARTPPRARLVRAGEPGRAWILAGAAAPRARVAALERAGARVIRVGRRGGKIDLRAAWRALARAGVNEVLVEGGGGLAAALLRAGLVDWICWLVAPRLIGGDGRPALASLGVRRLAAAPQLAWVRTERLGPDLVLLANR